MDSPATGVPERPPASPKRRILRVVIGLAILGVIVVILFPVFYTDVPESRLAGTELYRIAAHTRSAWLEMAAEGVPAEAAAQALSVSHETERLGAMVVTVDPDGRVTVRSAQYGVTLHLTPAADPEAPVVCSGSPAEDLPLACR